MRLLIFYFEPFGIDTINSSEQAAGLLPDAIGEHKLMFRRLPVSFSRSAAEAIAAVAECAPDMVLCLGQAARPRICLERVAVNLANAAARPDNDGYRPENEQIIARAPERYISQIPVDEIASALQEKGYPVAVSESAGQFVCNSLYYNLLHTCNTIPVLFIHIPLTAAQLLLRPDAKSPAVSSHIAASAICETINLLIMHYSCGN